jgi:hypothetical protein
MVEPGSLVANGDPRVASRQQRTDRGLAPGIRDLLLVELEPHLCSLAARLHRVADQVGHDPLDLDPVADHRRARHRQLDLELDLRGHELAKPVLELAHLCAQLEALHVHRSAAREDQELLRQRRRALAAIDDLLEIRARGVAFSEIVVGELGVPEDAREQVVEVVRDAARQHAEALELAGVAQLSFGADPLGHVAHHAHHAS